MAECDSTTDHFHDDVDSHCARPVVPEHACAPTCASRSIPYPGRAAGLRLWSARMDLLVTSVRRLIWLVLLSAVGGATYAWWRDRQMADDLAPAEWPPLTPDDTPRSAPAADAEERATPAATTWMAPLDDGSCPDGYPIKANDKSGIFHVPGGRFYERTKPERCYASAEAALADGYRQSKS